jgi:hypothetical protein
MNKLKLILSYFRRAAKPKTDPSKRELFEFEKYKYYISIVKWEIGSVVLVVLAGIINNGFQERNAGIQEMQAFDKYVEIILKADNIEERWKLSEFFSTVTPTERLRSKWVDYNRNIRSDYDTFKKLKESELALTEEKSLAIGKEKFQEVNIKLNKIRKQLEPFEKKLASTNASIDRNVELEKFEFVPNQNYRPVKSSNVDPESSLKKFKEEIKKDSSSDFRYRLSEYIDKITNINNSVVNNLVKELGDPFQNIQTGVGTNYKEATYSNQYGIISKFDETKKIWPVLVAKFYKNAIVITLEENGEIEKFEGPLSSLDNDEIKKFIRAFYIKRLDQLH